MDTNLLYYGDNLDVLRRVESTTSKRSHPAIRSGWRGERRIASSAGS
jgi:hypothetical protein